MIKHWEYFIIALKHVSQEKFREVCDIVYEEGRMTKDMTLLTTVSILTRYTKKRVKIMGE
jgi:hypothetical protein